MVNENPPLQSQPEQPNRLEQFLCSICQHKKFFIYRLKDEKNKVIISVICTECGAMTPKIAEFQSLNLGI